MTDTTSSILRFIPRKGLYTIISLMMVGLVYMAGARVRSVEAASQEAKAEASEAKRKAEDAYDTAIQTLNEMREMRMTIESIRVITLEHFKWQAEQRGDTWRAERYRRMREHPEQDPVHVPAGPSQQSQ